MNISAIAKDLVPLLGGKENIVSAAHCATRLRLVLADDSKVNKAAIDRLTDVIADVLHDGVPVVIASQCQQAEVLLGHYETGDAIARAGAIGSGDMTLEATYAKIMFLLSQGVDAADFGTWMRRNIAGEISPSSM